MRNWRRFLAGLLAAALFIPMIATAEESGRMPDNSAVRDRIIRDEVYEDAPRADDSNESVAQGMDVADSIAYEIETPPDELMFELEENAADVSKAADGPEAHFYELTVDPAQKAQTFPMDVGDTLRIRVADATVTGWKPSKKDIVSYTSGVDAVGAYTDFKPEKEIKKLKLTATLSGHKKKKVDVNLVISNPYVPTAIGFKAAMPASVPMGTTIKLPEMVTLTPSYAVTELSYKCTGAAKAAKDGTLTTKKAGTAKITVTASNNKKAKATFSLQVLANKITKMTETPQTEDFAAVSGGWTLWPVSVEVSKKGGLNCVFNLINGTGDALKQIENLNLTLAVGTPGNVIASLSQAKVKVSVAKNKAKVLKINFPPAACPGLADVFLPEHFDNGTLFFDINADSVVCAAKNNKYPFIATKFPVEFTAATQEGEATLNVGETVSLEALGFSGSMEGLTWSSTAPSVATISDGVITALSGGVAGIMGMRGDALAFGYIVRVNFPEGVTISDLPQITLTPIPLDGVSDPELRQAYEAYNARIDEINALDVQINENFDSLDAQVVILDDEIGDVSVTESAEQISMTLDSMTIDLNRAACDALRGGAELTVIGLTDDGLDLEISGKTYTLYLTEDAVTLEPKGEITIAKNGLFSSLRSKQDKLFNWVSKKYKSIIAIYEYVRDYVPEGLKKNTDARAMCKAELDTLKAIDPVKAKLSDKDILKNFMRKQTLIEKIAKYDDVIKWFSIASGFLGALEATGAVRHIGELIEKWTEIRSIDAHGHPYKEDFPRTIIESSGDFLYNQIATMYVLIAVDGALSLASFVEGVSTTFAAIMTIITKSPHAGIVALAGGTITSITFLVDIIVSFIEDTSYGILIAEDNKLHSYITGQVFDAKTGEPIGGLRVTWDVGKAEYINVETYTNSQGYYRIQVEPGSCALRFSKSPYSDVTNLYSVNAWQDLSVDPVTMKTRSLSGRVTCRDPQTIMGGVTVSCPELGTVTTDENGLYSFTNVPAGTYVLSFSVPNVPGVTGDTLTVTITEKTNDVTGADIALDVKKMYYLPAKLNYPKTAAEANTGTWELSTLSYTGGVVSGGFSWPGALFYPYACSLFLSEGRLGLYFDYGFVDGSTPVWSVIYQNGALDYVFCNSCMNDGLNLSMNLDKNGRLTKAYASRGNGPYFYYTIAEGWYTEEYIDGETVHVAASVEKGAPPFKPEEYMPIPDFILVDTMAIWHP